MDAIKLLEKDHRKLEGLFERYRSATNGKAAIVAEISRELSMHMDAEERELYPVLRTTIEDGPDLMADAVREHHEARGLLAELAKLEDGSFAMDAKVATLRRAIDHHVKDEEQEIFPKTRAAFGAARIGEIGTRIERAKRSARTSPPPSAARNSPGASVGGVVSAASDRVKNFLVPPLEQPKRAAARSKKTRRTVQAASRARKTGSKRKTRARAVKSTARKRVARRKSR